MNNEDYEFVRMIASYCYKKYCPKGSGGPVSFDDILHYGYVGFLVAKENYKSQEGDFKPYAYQRVFGHILDEVRKLPMIRIPKEQYRKLKELNLTRKDLDDKNIDPSPKILAQTLGWSIETVFEVQALGRYTVDIDDDTNPGAKFLLPPEKSEPEKELLKSDLKDIIKFCLEMIPDKKDRLVFVSRKFDDMTLDQVSQILGCAIETARRRQMRATDSMKSCLSEHGWNLKS